MKINFKIDTTIIDQKFSSNKRFTVQVKDIDPSDYSVTWYETENDSDKNTLRKMSTGDSFDYIEMDARPAVNSKQIQKYIYVLIELKNGTKSEFKKVFTYTYYSFKTNSDQFKIE
jgi:hypothetical protein